jgi:hypothetical protein
MPKHNVPPEIESTAKGGPGELIEPSPDDELRTDPPDFSAVGGPEGEAAYGRTRAIAGEYPFNAHGGPYDRDEPSHVERGGSQTHHRIEKRT